MSYLSDNISAMSFRRIPGGKLKKLSLDGRMSKVLMAVDGEKSVTSLAGELAMDEGVLKGILIKLHDRNLIETVKKPTPNNIPEFISYAKLHLSLAIGPLAEVILEDAVSDLGYRMDSFPKQKAAELTELLSRQIQHEEKRDVFKKKLFDKIKDKTM